MEMIRELGRIRGSPRLQEGRIQPLGMKGETGRGGVGARVKEKPWAIKGTEQGG